MPFGKSVEGRQFDVQSGLLEGPGRASIEPGTDTSATTSLAPVAKTHILFLLTVSDSSPIW